MNTQIKLRASKLHAVFRIPRIISRIFSYIGQFSLFVLVSVVTLDVVLRAARGSGLPGLVDYVSVGMAGMVFLALAYSEEMGAHIRTPIFTSRMSDSLAQTLRGGAMVTASLVMFWLAWATVGRAVVSLERLEVAPGVAAVPVWPVRLIIPIGAALLAIELLRKGINDLYVRSSSITQATDARVAEEAL